MQFPFDQEIILENERVRLSPLSLSDIPGLLPVAVSDDKLIQYSPARIHSNEFLTDYIITALREKERRNRYPFVIYDKSKQAYAGSTSFMNISQPNDRLEIGSTWIGREFQRTGLNRHCKYLLLEFAFEQTGLERVELQTDERNLQSREAIEKIGAKYEGIFRSYITMPDGFRRNSVFYSIIRQEWPEVKKLLSLSVK